MAPEKGLCAARWFAWSAADYGQLQMSMGTCHRCACGQLQRRMGFPNVSPSLACACRLLQLHLYPSPVLWQVLRHRLRACRLEGRALWHVQVGGSLQAAGRLHGCKWAGSRLRDARTLRRRRQQQPTPHGMCMIVASWSGNQTRLHLNCKQWLNGWREGYANCCTVGGRLKRVRGNPVLLQGKL